MNQCKTAGRSLRAQMPLQCCDHARLPSGKTTGNRCLLARSHPILCGAETYSVPPRKTQTCGLSLSVITTTASPFLLDVFPFWKLNINPVTSGRCRTFGYFVKEGLGPRHLEAKASEYKVKSLW